MTQTPLQNDSARNVAVNCVAKFTIRRQRIRETLDHAFDQGQIDPRQRPLATELAYGTCRRLITLDHLIARQSKRGLNKVDDLVLAILQVALYQLIYTSDAPDFAIVDEAVKQAKLIAPGAGTFVNAILRSIQRLIIGPVTADTEELPQATIWLSEDQGVTFATDIFPPPERNRSKYFSLAYAMPPWLVERWIKNYGQDKARQICLAHNARPPLTLRPNRLRCTPAELIMRLTKLELDSTCHGDAVQLIGSAAVEKLPGYDTGDFVVQDMTAIDVAPRLGVSPGMRVLDLCAAPGGKTTHLAELMLNKGQIIACDVSPKKLELINQNSKRLGHSIIKTCLVDDIDAEIAASGPFDAILLDVPCSNTGVFAKRIEARHSIKPNEIKKLVKIQRQILAQAAEMVKPQGKILYSTCSIEPAENELQVQKFLEQYSNFQLNQQWLTLPITKDPQLNHCSHDGGFTALLQRK